MPEIFRIGWIRIRFYSREESRIHVHAEGNGKLAKFWIEPAIALEWNNGFNVAEQRRIESAIRRRKDEIVEKWRQHFQG